MNIFSQLNLRQVSLLKMVGIGLLIMVVLAFVVRLFGASVGVPAWGNRASVVSAPSMPSYMGGVAQMGESAVEAYDMDAAKLSVRNIAPVPPGTGGGAGNDAEQFEVTNYHATIQTRELASTCGTVSDLKKHDYVIFEHANNTHDTCNYTFKVERSRVEEILAQIKELKPKALSENVDTIKRQVEDFTSEKEILEKKRDSIDKTLEDAIRAYEEITTLATQTQDASSLARVIESKLQILERLTQEKININAQLDRLTRAKAEQLDRLEYTYFYVGIYESKYVDGDELKDSWKFAVRQFMHDVNRIFQDLTVNLVTLLFLALQYLIYFFIILIIVKYVWKAAKMIWIK